MQCVRFEIKNISTNHKEITSEIAGPQYLNGSVYQKKMIFGKVAGKEKVGGWWLLNYFESIVIIVRRNRN